MTSAADAAALPKTIPHVVLRAAQTSGASPAVIEDGRTTTYAALAALMRRAGAAFHAAGVRSGDRVAIWMPNRLEYIVAALGIQSLGAAIVTINTRFKAHEAQYILNKSRSKMLVLVDRFLGQSYPDMLKGIDLPLLERRIVVDGPGADGWDAFLATATPAGEAAVTASLEAMSGEEISDIMFTSGTTGAPKGVMSKHVQNVRMYDQWARSMGVRPDERSLGLYPFFHCAGYKAGWLSNFLRAAAIVPVQNLDTGTLGEFVARHKVTFIPGPPALFQTLLALPAEKRGDLSTLRTANTGAANVPPVLIDRIRNELGIRRVLVGYGLTETCGTVSLSEENDTAEVVARTCGKTIPGVEVRVVDDSGKSLPLGEPGEIIVRGYNVMVGYFDDPEATQETIDKDGWLHTGDIGTLDERGYIRITDRKKDMFIVGGFNCYPAEIEKIMTTNPDFAQVAVVGVPDERMGEVGKAYVILRPGSAFTPEKIIAWCRDNMANYKVPRYVEIVDVLPTNATGKVQKFRLRDGEAAPAAAR
jgi:acyl-CoA synthetase (AMP-forming)/AMP-acid ligase II